jgi:YD repeat-containing protein
MIDETNPSAFYLSYSARIDQASPTAVHVMRADHKALPFTRQDGRWLPTTPDVNATLEELTDASGRRTGWDYTTGEDDVETYDAVGRLLSITTRAGLTQSLGYDARGRLKSVTDPFGRTLMFDYNPGDRVRSVTDPARETYSYTYDANNNLETVTGPDNKTRRYHYEDAAFPHALTGLDDENDDEFATWSYYSEPPVRGLVKTSEHAGGVDKVEVRYDFADKKTAVTDALGTTRTYTYREAFDVGRTSRAEKPSTSRGTASSSWDYDANGNIKSYIDYRGHRTEFTEYDLARNLEMSRTEAFRTSLQRTITTQWHPTFRLPTTITEPNRVISLDYDPADGTLTKRTVTAGGKSRTWGFQYDANGQIKEIDGPRTDVRDRIVFTYDDQGNLESQTNAVGHLTAFPEYDPHGRPKRIVDPNGVITTLGYDPRGRLTSHQVGGELTSYDYDDVGQLHILTYPDGSFLRFEYDAAHRLTDIIDHLGNIIHYAPDAVGNPVEEWVYDPQRTLTRRHSRAPDALNRLERSVDAEGHATVYTYDDNDNLTVMRNPLGDIAQWSYDALDRLETSTDFRGALTRYSYDANDRLDTVTDAVNHLTDYDYDGLGNLTRVSSPDTGLTRYTLHDEAGNVKSRTDARGQETTWL